MGRRGEYHLDAISISEHERNVLSSQLSVDAREAVQLVLEAGGIFGVQEALDQLSTVRGDTNSLSSDLSGVDEVFQNGSVNRGQRSRPGPGLLDTRAMTGLWQDTALTDEKNMAVRELLLQLSSQPGRECDVSKAPSFRKT